MSTGDSLRVNSLMALSAAEYYETGTRLGNNEAAATTGVTFCSYEPRGNRCELRTTDLTDLASDAGAMTHIVSLRGAAVPSTIQRGSRGDRGGGGGGGSHHSDAKALRVQWSEHKADGRSRGAFYRALVPSAAVKAAMAPALARIAAEQEGCQAQESDSLSGLVVVGVHVRQGDAHDMHTRVVGFHPTPGGGHSDAVVDHFIKEMARLQEKHAAAGKATIFFICSDQQRARCQLRARFGVAAIVEVESDEEAGGGVGEGRVGRGVRAMQHAVAEWLMLAGADVIIRSGKSSFSDEAALAGGVACINVRSPMT